MIRLTISWFLLILGILSTIYPTYNYFKFDTDNPSYEVLEICKERISNSPREFWGKAYENPIFKFMFPEEKTTKACLEALKNNLLAPFVLSIMFYFICIWYFFRIRKPKKNI